MAKSTFRVGGGGYTSFAYAGKTLLYVDVLSESSPKAVAAPEAIQPMDAEYPIEIAFPKAAGAGTLTIAIREQWASPVWAQLPGYGRAVDIVGVFKANLASGAITCQKIIKEPNGTLRGFQYHNVVVTNVLDDEEVRVGTMTFQKSLALMYTQRTSL